MKNVKSKSNAISELNFLPSEAGSTPVKAALVFAALAIVLALVVPTTFNENSALFARNSNGVDRIVTGAVKNTKRYHIRKSILDTQ